MDELIDLLLRAALHPIRSMFPAQQAAEAEEWLRREFQAIADHHREREAPQSVARPPSPRPRRAPRTIAEVVEFEQANRALIDLGTVGMAVTEIRPGQVIPIDPAQFNVGDMPNILREREDNPEPMHQSRESQARAKTLLWSYLNHQQREQLFLLNYFAVTGSRSGKIYRIANASTGNIIREDGITYCLVPDLPMPQWDQLLAQKLMIEDNERQFLKCAHRQGDDVAQGQLGQMIARVLNRV